MFNVLSRQTWGVFKKFQNKNTINEGGHNRIKWFMLYLRMILENETYSKDKPTKYTKKARKQIIAPNLSILKKITIVKNHFKFFLFFQKFPFFMSTQLLSTVA